MHYQVEYKGTDLFRATRSDLDSDVPVDGPVKPSISSVWTKREHDVTGVEPITERRSKHVDRMRLVFAHEAEATSTIVFPLST